MIPSLTFSEMERILIYSHDTYGLGHLRRCLRISKALVRFGQARHVLIASGSPRAKAFSLPPGVDIVALPAVTKRADGMYGALTLGIDISDLAKVRGDLVRSVAASFRPDAILVDHSPIGMGGELLPLLDHVATTNPKPILVLGMREIVDDAVKVEADWRAAGVWEHLGSSYDAVLVYGDPVVKTTALELGMARRLRIPVEHVGYVAPPPLARPSPRRHRPTLVVTVGGGGDGLPVLNTYIDFLHNSPLARRIRSVLVSGPFSPDAELGRQAEFLARSGVEILPFSDQMESLLATADGAITMAGYNTVAELLSYETPGILVPRVRPRVEQWLRATSLAAVTEFVPVGPVELSIELLERFVEELQGRGEARRPQLDLNGAHATAQALGRLARPSVLEHVR